MNCSSCSYSFTLCGTPIKLHYTYFIFLALITSASIKHFDALYTLSIFITYGPILIITLIIGGYGRLTTAKLLGGDSNEEMLLWPFGSLTWCGPTGKGPCGELTVSVAAPVTHILQGLLWYGLSEFVFIPIIANEDFYYNKYDDTIEGVENDFFIVIAAEAILLNIVLVVVNLLPMYPLDGGRVLVSMLLLCGFDQDRTGLIISKIGMVTSLIGAVLFGLLFTRSIFNALPFAYCFFVNFKLNSLAKDGRAGHHPLFSEQNVVDDNGALIYNDDDDEDGSTSVVFADRPWTNDEVSAVRSNIGDQNNENEAWWVFWKNQDDSDTEKLAANHESNEVVEDFGLE